MRLDLMLSNAQRKGLAGVYVDKLMGNAPKEGMSVVF